MPLDDVAHRYRDRLARVLHRRPTNQTIGRLHGDRTNDVVAEVQSNLEREGPRIAQALDLDVQRVEQLGNFAPREFDVDDRPR